MLEKTAPRPQQPNCFLNLLPPQPGAVPFVTKGSVGGAADDGKRVKCSVNMCEFDFPIGFPVQPDLGWLLRSTLKLGKDQVCSFP